MPIGMLVLMRKQLNNILLGSFLIIGSVSPSTGFYPTDVYQYTTADIQMPYEAYQVANTPLPRYTNPDIERNLPEVLKKVAFCESNQKQFYQNGEVIENINNNGTKDYGFFQINSIHFPETKRLGLDVINSKVDNIKFGLMLYERHGLTPWYGFLPQQNRCSWSEVDVNKLMEVYST